MSDNIKVSIIIPCRNEEKFISRCFDSIIRQDYPKEKLEVLVVDGMSEDKTREIINKFKIQKQPFGESASRPAKFKIQLIENSRKYTPFALNIGIKNAKGEIIIRVDAHAIYKKNYISKCVEYLNKYNADNVGGIIKTLPAKNTIVAKAIAISLSSPFGAASDFRVGSNSPKEVDTVFGGCYRKKVFKKIGFFNEKLIRSQDMEFNLRLKRAGGKILLAPDIVSYYYPPGTLSSFFKHNFIDGIWSIYPLKFVKTPFKIRHYTPLLFVLSLIGTLFLSIFFPLFFWLFLFIFGLYFLANIYFFTKIAFREKDFRYLFLMPVTFACRHIVYGLGSIWGLIKILIK